MNRGRARRLLVALSILPHETERKIKRRPGSVLSVIITSIKRGEENGRLTVQVRIEDTERDLPLLFPALFHPGVGHFSSSWRLE